MSVGEEKANCQEELFISSECSPTGSTKSCRPREKAASVSAPTLNQHKNAVDHSRQWRTKITTEQEPRLEELPEGPEEEAGEHHGGGKSQDPCHKQVADSTPLQARAVGGHGAGYAGREHVCGTDGQTKSVGGANGGHRRNFGGCALCVSQVVLADFLAHGDHNALPANHGPEAQCQSYGNLNPKGNETSRAVQVDFVVLQHGGIRGGELRFSAFLHEANGFASQIHVVAEVANLVVRNVR